VLLLLLHHERGNVSLDGRRRKGLGPSHSVGGVRTSSCRRRITHQLGEDGNYWISTSSGRYDAKAKRRHMPGQNLCPENSCSHAISITKSELIRSGALERDRLYM
jgi:hypothetical protein